MSRYDERTALVVVDLQNDFADPAGSLAVIGGEAIVPAVNAAVRDALDAGAFVVVTQDWHPETTPHFAKDGGIWPVHCVAGTWGAELHPAFEVPIDVPRVRKGMNGEDGYSGFTMRDPESGEETSHRAGGLLRARRPSSAWSSAAWRRTTASRQRRSTPCGSDSRRDVARRGGRRGRTSHRTTGIERWLEMAEAGVSEH